MPPARRPLALPEKKWLEEGAVPSSSERCGPYHYHPLPTGQDNCRGAVRIVVAGQFVEMGRSTGSTAYILIPAPRGRQNTVA
jgi:hypothetical protein